MRDKRAMNRLWARSHQERSPKLLDIEMLEIAPGYAKVA